MIRPVPVWDMVDHLASRYGVSPYEVAEWPIPDAAALWYASIRNDVRRRIDWINDRVASNEISAEIKHYDEHGRPIRGGGKSDPVGFKRHVSQLYRVIGVDIDLDHTSGDSRTKTSGDKGDVAKRMEKFFLSALMGTGSS